MTESTNNSKLDFDSILPYGEKIRPLIASSFLTENDLKKLLAQKGIFISSTHKKHTVPLLATCLLSPDEFEFLRSRQRIKENNKKIITREVAWESDCTLFDALKKEQIPFSDFMPRRSTNYHLSSKRNKFTYVEDKDELILEYTIDRDNPTRDWSTNKSRHEGKVILKRDEEKKKLKMIMEYTAVETKELNDHIIKHIVKVGKQNNYIRRDDTMKKILFGEFSNKERVEFLLSLHSENPYDIFSFKEITNVEISLDTSKVLPEDIKWMENKVRNLILKGEKLHDAVFLTEPKYHDCLIIASIEAVYDFSSFASKGSCTIEYGFLSRSHLPDGNSEFEFKITKLNFESNKPKKKVEGFLLSKFELYKTHKYELIKPQSKPKPKKYQA